MIRTTIVYESMFGQTRRIAEAMARGAADAGGDEVQVTVKRVSDVSGEDVTSSDVLVVGGPTHAHSMSRPATRTEAEKWSQDPERQVSLEPHALGTGVREFLGALPPTGAAFLAFDTRADSAELFTGSAAKAIGKRLKKKGLDPLLPAESFVVTKEGRLVDGEEERAESVGRSLVEAARRPVPIAAS